MMRKIVLFLVPFVLSFSSVGYAQWVQLDKSSFAGAEPDVQLISDSPSETVFKVSLPGFYIKELSDGSRTYQSIGIGDQALISQPGAPALPYIAKVLALPDNGSVQVDVIEHSAVQKFSDIHIQAVRETGYEGQPEMPYEEDASIYGSENYFPAVSVNTEDPAVFRDFRVARISVFPIRYSPVRKELEVTSSMTVRVRYTAGNECQSEDEPASPYPPLFRQTLPQFYF